MEHRRTIQLDKSTTGRALQQVVVHRFQGTPYRLYLADCLEWIDVQAPSSVHAIVTDPPYGLKEYTLEEKAKFAKRTRGRLAYPAVLRRVQAESCPALHRLDGIRSRPPPKFLFRVC